MTELDLTPKVKSDDFTDELSDEALDREGDRACVGMNCAMTRIGL
jgi:hypothetical protein